MKKYLQIAVFSALIALVPVAMQASENDKKPGFFSRAWKEKTGLIAGALLMRSMYYRAKNHYRSDLVEFIGGKDPYLNQTITSDKRIHLGLSLATTAALGYVLYKFMWPKLKYIWNGTNSQTTAQQ